MAYPIDVQTTDQWQLFSCPNSIKIIGSISQITGQPTGGVLIAFGDGVPAASAVFRQTETYLPALISLARRFDAVRIMSAVAGQPCIVHLTAVPEGEGT